MKEVTVIILNYMNYQETISCVESVLLQEKVFVHVVIVDNGSKNESYKVLKRQYMNNSHIHVIRAGKNYGFAKGNNIGIKYARGNFNTDYIMLLNSDTELVDKNYLSIMLAYVEPDIGVIGSKVILRNGNQQKRYYEYVDFQSVLCQYFTMLCKKYGFKGIESKLEKELANRKTVEMIHGCAFMLTPAFFKKNNYLYDKTFLYTEEIQLYFLCQRLGLKQIYIEDTYLYHKEDQSSKFLFQNRASEKDAYVLSSYKYVVWECWKNRRILENRRN